MHHERIGDAKAVRIAASGELDDAASALGLHVGVPVLVVGGADSMSRAEEARVKPDWGDESPWLARFAATLAGPTPAPGVPLTNSPPARLRGHAAARNRLDRRGKDRARR
jgi:hypothetical protein